MFRTGRKSLFSEMSQTTSFRNRVAFHHACLTNTYRIGQDSIDTRI